MRAKCLVEEMEGRELDCYDLITVLGLLKEYDWKEIWRRYSPGGGLKGKVDLRLSTESHYVELTLESLASLAVSPKYQASPNLIQSLIRRILCGHRHGLIVEKLRNHGVPIEDDTQLKPVLLGGDHRGGHGSQSRPQCPGIPVPQVWHQPGGARRAASPGPLRPRIRSLSGPAEPDGAGANRYVPQEILNEGTPDEQVARFNSQAVDYRVDLLFQRIRNDVPRVSPNGAMCPPARCTRWCGGCLPATPRS